MRGEADSGGRCFGRLFQLERVDWIGGGKETRGKFKIPEILKKSLGGRVARRVVAGLLISHLLSTWDLSSLPIFWPSKTIYGPGGVKASWKRKLVPSAEGVWGWVFFSFFGEWEENRACRRDISFYLSRQLFLSSRPSMLLLAALVGTRLICKRSSSCKWLLSRRQEGCER